MVERNIEQIYAIFYTMVYSKKVELEQYQRDILDWTDKDAQLKHAKLDELQMLLESFHEKTPLEASYTEVISDFRLFEEVFQYKIPLGSVPKECGVVSKDGTLKLTVKERIRFLNWYLRQHHNFFKKSYHVEYFHQLAFYVLERDRMFGFISKIDFETQKKLYFDYNNLFYERQKDSLQLMQYFGLPTEKNRSGADQILKKWHISKRYRDGLLENHCFKEITHPQQSMSVSSKRVSIDPSLRKEKLRRFHELWDGKKILKYLNEEELVELRDLFLYCYGNELGNTLFRTVIIQNNALLEEKKEIIRQSCFDVLEEELYQKMILLEMDPVCMIPYYYEIIKNAQKEMDDLLSEVVFETDLGNYEIYCEMIHDEFLKMKEAYSSLYVNGNQNRKKELD